MRSRSLYSACCLLWGTCTIHAAISLRTITLLFGTGLLLWTLGEYFLHRWGYHQRLARGLLTSGFADWYQAHHGEPESARHRDIPLSATLPVYVILYGIAYLATQDLVAAGVFISGLLTGYLAYEGLHAALHGPHPRSRLLRDLRRTHMIHHYTEPNHAFGVTSPLWDVIFHTRPHHRAPVTRVEAGGTWRPR